MSNKKYIVADWGGTNFRSALSSDSGVGEIKKYKCADFKSPEAILSQASLDVGIKSSDLSGYVIAIAGPAHNSEQFNFPNNSNFGTINFSQIEKNLGTKIFLIHDFAAQAYGALALRREELENITPEIESTKIPSELWDRSAYHTPIVQIPPKNRYIIAGPGTGLGICMLGVNGANVVVTDGEGGNVNFSACTDDEFDLISDIHSHASEMSCEALVSGRGLVHIFKSLTGGWDKDIKPETVTAAIKNGEPVAKRVCDYFTKAFGRAVGNSAIINQATGGIIIPSGSIVSALGSEFNAQLFVQEFKRNGYSDMASKSSFNPLNGVPVFIMKKEETGILGAHVFARSLG